MSDSPPSETPGSDTPTRLRLFLRSLLIQAAWNPRDLLGTGLAWALDGHESDETDRSFNSHPYLSGLAIGALHRMREEGASADERRRFRHAIRGPLGALGDALVWTGWVPGALILAGSALLLGLPPLAAALVFLALHNLAHGTLRWWAVGAGLRRGRAVHLAFRELNLGGLGARTRALTLFLAGVLLGVLAVRAGGLPVGSALWSAAAAVALAVGLVRGMRLPGPLPALALLLCFGVVLVAAGLQGS